MINIYGHPVYPNFDNIKPSLKKEQHRVVEPVEPATRTKRDKYTHTKGEIVDIEV
jgi:hypothetical protein